MTDTPRTDAISGRALCAHYGPSKSDQLYMDSSGPFVWGDFARELEREGNQLRAEVARLREAALEAQWVLVHSTQTWPNRHGKAIDMLEAALAGEP